MAKTENIILTNEAGESIKLSQVLETLNEKLTAYYIQSMSLSAEPGNKYIRLVTATSSGKNRSCYAFLDYKGNILKSAGWKAPAKHIRGTVFSQDMGWGKALGPYGAVYLR
jgi:hypothetical protein